MKKVQNFFKTVYEIGYRTCNKHEKKRMIGNNYNDMIIKRLKKGDHSNVPERIKTQKGRK